jgi:hypothetical protein
MLYEFPTTFLDDESHSVEHARKYGHTHLRYFIVEIF